MLSSDRHLSLRVVSMPLLDDRIVQLLEQLPALLVTSCGPHTQMRSHYSSHDSVGEGVALGRLDVFKLLEYLKKRERKEKKRKGKDR
jgi:hypothetical protein